MDVDKPQTEEARRSIRPAYHGLPVNLQHCLVQTGCVQDEPNDRQSSCFPGTCESFVIFDVALTPCNFDYLVGLGLLLERRMGSMLN